MQVPFLFVLAAVATGGALPSSVAIRTVAFGGLAAEIVDDEGRDPGGRATAVIRLRAVLPGLVYRAGRNARFMPYGKNGHPPTRQVLDSLCASGFRRVYFLYADPLPTSPVECGSGRASVRVPYEHARVVQEVEAPQRLAPARDRLFPARDRVLAAVQAAIKRGRREPILLQDRAGLHAVGYIAAIILRQFCGIDRTSAVNYWKATADRTGADTYPELLDAIRDFEPLPAYRIDRQQAQAVCPLSVKLPGI